ncbi:glycosyltransferase family 2 protein [Desulfopila inferna]|uniref:glycosyltransferase family 2 protein n=1 Tax=Desulfopila inferna TaxID=468528 RepID=UPI0019623F27|nr:glycosyltransferase family 2 protein [Desulfopila inferna]MBM9602679.1 glycosyltransferase family 2 protein [Desulfopila inferna]
MQKNMLAVCMPAYNSGDFIANAISSILNQTYSEFTFIITDDGSQDNTVEIVKSFDDRRIIFFQNESNQGTVPTRNDMLDYCLGNGFSYMSIMDADDIAYPQRLARQVQILESDPTIAVCGSSMKMRKNNSIWAAPEEHDEVKVETIFRNAIPTSTATIRLLCMKLHNLRWDAEFAPCADYHLWYKVIFECGLRVKNTGKIDMVYSYTPNGISHGAGLEKQELKDASVKQLILSRFSINSTLNEAASFMKISLHRSDCISDASPFLNIADKLLRGQYNCTVDHRLLKKGLRSRAKTYLAKARYLPDSIHAQFVDLRLIRGLTFSKIEGKLKYFKYNFLDIKTPELSFFLVTIFYAAKRIISKLLYR